MSMKIFGHYVALPTMLLAFVDGAVFFTTVELLGLGHWCAHCYLAAGGTLGVVDVALLAIAFVLIATSVGLYNSDAIRNFPVFLKRFALAGQIIFIPSVLILAITKISRGVPFGWFVGVLSVEIVLFLAFLLAVRTVLLLWLDLPFLKRRILILGQGETAAASDSFIRNAGSGHLVLARAIPANHHAVRRLSVDGTLALQPAPGSTAPLIELARSLHIDEIVVAVTEHRGLPIWQLLECKLAGINVIDYLAFWERETGCIDFAHAGPGWLTFSSGFTFKDRDRTLKRIFDFAISLCFLLAMAPVMILTAIAITLESRGPIFYRQERVGLNGALIRLWKFRSMHVNAEADGNPKWASRSDNRITRVGRFIRKVRIDEVPQAINVLLGEMSFIGPRPERPYFVEQLRKEIPYYDLRHKVKPGITGWAQVNYPYCASIDDAKKKHAYDLYYVKNHDIFLDLAILAQTVRVVLFAEGAR